VTGGNHREFRVKKSSTLLCCKPQLLPCQRGRGELASWRGWPRSAVRGHRGRVVTVGVRVACFCSVCWSLSGCRQVVQCRTSQYARCRQGKKSSQTGILHTQDEDFFKKRLLFVGHNRYFPPA